MSMSLPGSVEDTAIGLTDGERQILRQQLELRRQQQHRVQGGSNSARAPSRNSSTVASAASSSIPGRIALDPASLQSLHNHFDGLLHTIRVRYDRLQEALEQSVQSNATKAGASMREAQAEINRVNKIIDDISRIEADFKRVKNIRDTIKRLRERVDAASERLNRSRPTPQSEGRSHGHSSHSRHERPERRDHYERHRH